MPKTNAEICREYRRRKNENKKKKNPGKSSTERGREFRARKKQLLNKQNSCSNISDEVKDVTDVINDPSQQQNSVPTGYNLVNNDLKQEMDIPTSSTSEEELQKLDFLPEKSLESYNECLQIIRPLKEYILRNDNKQALLRLREIDNVLKYFIKNEKRPRKSLQ